MPTRISAGSFAEPFVGLGACASAPPAASAPTAAIAAAAIASRLPAVRGARRTSLRAAAPEADRVPVMDPPPPGRAVAPMPAAIVRPLAKRSNGAASTAASRAAADDEVPRLPHVAPRDEELVDEAAVRGVAAIALEVGERRAARGHDHVPRSLAGGVGGRARRQARDPGDRGELAERALDDARSLLRVRVFGLELDEGDPLDHPSSVACAGSSGVLVQVDRSRRRKRYPALAPFSGNAREM